MDLNFFIFLLTIVTGLLYFYIRKAYTFWTKLGIKQLPPTFPFGNAFPLFKMEQSTALFFRDLYEKTKHDRYIGMYNLFDPALVVNDPRLIKDILVRDTSYFPHRGMHIDEQWDPLSGNLITLSGQKWKNLREKLTPTFTVGKIKAFFPILLKIAQTLQDVAGKSADIKELEVRELMACYTTDIIASIAFGNEANSIKNSEDQFRKIGRHIFQPNVYTVIRFAGSLFFPKLMRLFRVKVATPDVETFFINFTETNLEYREKNDVVRKDFFQLLVQLRNTGKVTESNDWKAETVEGKAKQMTIEEVAAQSFIFFVAGFETTSSTTSFCLFELARNPEIQRKLQADIDAALSRNGGEFTFEALQEMTYLDNCIDETLRIYPPLPVLTRQCERDYQVPDSNVTIPRKSMVTIPIIGLHRDPEYYPEPMKFIPERFTDPANAETLKKAYFPFGDGPRICIAMRLGKTMAKLGLSSLLAKYDFELSNPSDAVGNLELHKMAVTLAPAKGIYLNLKKRTTSRFQ